MDGDLLHYENFISNPSDADIEEYRRRTLGTRSDQLATIIYTSGTTGEPKGVMLTHSNLSSNQIDSFQLHDLRPDDFGLSFLPLAHVYERIVDYGYLFNGVTLAYLERMEQLPAALAEVRPTAMAAVPRVFEKIYAAILEKMHEARGFKRRLFEWAFRVAREALPWRVYARPVALGIKLEWVLANLLVYARIRAALGGRVRLIFSGGAPLARELAEFFWSVGVPIY
jgi:long-chain acyl-CoA synthetase